jgi:hypothetical protein
MRLSFVGLSAASRYIAFRRTRYIAYSGDASP